MRSFLLWLLGPRMALPGTLVVSLVGCRSDVRFRAGLGCRAAGRFGREARRCARRDPLIPRGPAELCQFPPVSCHVALVFGKGAGEHVAPVVVADEVEGMAGRGME